MLTPKRLPADKAGYKLLVIVGPTSSGKSELAVRVAKKFNGEIISCDSRQIYEGMNLGTGKVNGKWLIPKNDGRQKLEYRYKNIIHHCIDFVNPKQQYSAALFQRNAKKAILDIIKRGKLPILCGGTANWVDAVVYDQKIPDVKPNFALRQKLEQLSTVRLFAALRKRDPVRAKTIDKHNRRRLIRALEIIYSTGLPVPTLSVIPEATSASEELSGIHTLWLGMALPQTDLYKKIDRRLKQRIKQGMLKEVRRLHTSGLPWKNLEDFGLEYRFVSRYLRSIITYDELILQLSLAIKHYSKRQMTWWKRNSNIVWIKTDFKKSVKLVEKFLK